MKYTSEILCSTSLFCQFGECSDTECEGKSSSFASKCSVEKCISMATAKVCALV